MKEKEMKQVARLIHAVLAENKNVKRDVSRFAKNSPSGDERSARRAYHGLQGFQNDKKIENERAVFEIVDVVLKFLAHIIHVPIGVVVDLRPSGDAGFQKESYLVIRYLSLGPRRIRGVPVGADERNIPTADVPKLR